MTHPHRLADRLRSEPSRRFSRDRAVDESAPMRTATSSAGSRWHGTLAARKVDEMLIVGDNNARAHSISELVDPPGRLRLARVDRRQRRRSHAGRPARRRPGRRAPGEVRAPEAAAWHRAAPGDGGRPASQGASGAPARTRPAPASRRPATALCVVAVGAVRGARHHRPPFRTSTRSSVVPARSRPAWWTAIAGLGRRVPDDIAVTGCDRLARLRRGDRACADDDRRAPGGPRTVGRSPNCSRMIGGNTRPAGSRITHVSWSFAGSAP